MSFRAELIARLGWNWTEGAVDNGKLHYAERWVDGVMTDEAEGIWHDENLALADGATDRWDLTALPRTILGDTHDIAFERIKAIEIVNLSTTGGTLIVGNAPVNPWWEPFGAYDHTVQVPLDSPLVLCNRRDGWIIGPSASGSSSSGEGLYDNILQIAADGGAVTYSLAILGTLNETPSSSSGA